jgi:hypothetical protein
VYLFSTSPEGPKDPFRAASAQALAEVYPGPGTAPVTPRRRIDTARHFHPHGPPSQRAPEHGAGRQWFLEQFGSVVACSDVGLPNPLLLLIVGSVSVSPSSPTRMPPFHRPSSWAVETKTSLGIAFNSFPQNSFPVWRRD